MIKRKRRIFKSDAVLTRLSISKNNITRIIKHEVNNIENVGVPLFDIFENIPGKSWSFPIAIGSLDAANNPAFAVVIKAKIAAIAIIEPPIPAKSGMESAPTDIGVNVPFKSIGSDTPIVTKIMRI